MEAVPAPERYWLSRMILIKWTMSARPPPARPHIGLNPVNRFTSYSFTDWVDDDAWDSGSDSESPTKNPWKRQASASGSTPPRPVPRTAQNNSSSSTLASSYTHIHAPNPGSYNQKSEVQPPKNGWTMVNRQSAERRNSEAHHDRESIREESADVEVESDMVVGEMDPDVPDHSVTAPVTSGKVKADKSSIRRDIDNIMNGNYPCILALTNISFCYFFIDPLHLARRKPTKRQRLDKLPEDLSEPGASEKLARERSIKSHKRNKFVQCIVADDVNMGMSLHLLSCPEPRTPAKSHNISYFLKHNCENWHGTACLRIYAQCHGPYFLYVFRNKCRSQTSRCNLLLQGYLPLPASSRATTLARKRQEYQSLVELAFARNREGLDQQIWHQIEIDVPRTRPGVKLWMHGSTQRVSLDYDESRNVVNRLPFTEFRTNIICMGNPTSCKWLCPGHQRPRNTFLPSLPLCIHR